MPTAPQPAPGFQIINSPENGAPMAIPTGSSYAAVTGNAPSPVNTSTGQPTTGTPTPMPAPVKSALETAANSAGNGISSVPTTKTSTPIDYTWKPNDTIDTYNARIAAARQAGGTQTDSSSDTSGSLPNINDLISGLGARPTAPDTATVQANAETQYGVTDLTNTLNTQNQQLMALQNDLQNRQANEASKPGVVATIINGRMQMLSAQDSKALKDLQASIKDTTTRLNQANTAVATVMKNTQTDYNNAVSSYEKSYSDAMKVYTDAETQQNKQQVQAKANAQVIINSYKGSSTGTNSITDDDRAQWSQLELQAGMPTGTIEAAVKAELNITKFSKGSDGNMYVSGTDDNGVPYTAKVENSQGSGGGTKPKNTIQQDTDQATAMIEARIKNNPRANGDHYLGPDEWANYRAAWVAAGTGHTAANFNTIFGKYKNPTTTYN